MSRLRRGGPGAQLDLDAELGEPQTHFGAGRADLRPSPSPSITRLTHDGLQCGGVDVLLVDLKPLPLPQPVSARIGRR